MNEYIKASLGCLNQLIRLGLQRSQFQMATKTSNSGESTISLKDQRSPKFYYLDNLVCVQELTQQLQSSACFQEIYEELDLCSLVCFYANSEVHHSEGSDKFSLSATPVLALPVSTLALEVLQNTALLWQISSSGPPFDLSYLLAHKGFVSKED